MRLADQVIAHAAAMKADNPMKPDMQTWSGRLQQASATS